MSITNSKSFINVYTLDIDGKEVQTTISSELIKRIIVEYNEDNVFSKNFRTITGEIETKTGEKYKLKTDNSINKKQITGKSIMLLGAIYFPNRIINE